MENVLKRLNTLLFIISVFVGLYAVNFYLAPWAEYNASETFLGVGHGKMTSWSIVMGALIPAGYCLGSAIVSWVLGQGFKMHFRIKT